MEQSHTDSDVQKAIAQRLREYRQINLTVPAQRDEADEVRAEFGLPPLAALHEATTHLEPATHSSTEDSIDYNIKTEQGEI